jgi:hypothetical protein
MTSSKIKDIQKLLCEKSNTKQQVFQITQNTFASLKKVMKEVSEDLFPCLVEDAPKVEVKYTEKGDFEAHLKFSGDTLVVMMHTNIFDFDESHYVLKNPYIKEDPMREFCGLIQIYNFLADSIKYNREQDIGYLIGRIFVNKEKHFFIDGKRPLSFLYSDIAKNQVTEEVLRNVIEEAMLFCLNFDLLAAPLDAISYISVEQKNLMSYSSGMPTGKRLGFTMSGEQED